MTQIMDILALHTGTLHSDDVQTAEISMVADRTAVRNEIVGQCRHTANKSMMANTRELVNSRTAAENGVMTDFDVATNHNVVSKCDVIANIAIMRDVCIGEKLAIVANARVTTATVRTAVHSNTFAYKAVIANN
ncbi:MAG: hypothetical protein GAK38_04564 [Xylophilus sp.]|nr:MAG: hypothetical protein GAK38_04564 [Xylophilus sp.]